MLVKRTLETLEVVVIISIIAIIIAIILVSIFAVLSYRSRSVEWTCPPGSCPTSTITGEKDCTRSEYNPGTEVCVSQYACDNQALPFSVLSNNGTTNDGLCEPGTEYNASGNTCRCVTRPTCPQYTTATFGLSNSRIDQSSYQPGQPVTDLCSITIDSLFGVGGYCSVTEDWSTTAGKLTDVTRCIQANPCLFGQLAYIADPSELTINSYHYHPLACVIGRTGYDSFGMPLQAGAVTIWDSGWGGVVQKIL